MKKVFRVTVDISKKIPAPAFEVNTNDLKSVKLEITITNGQSLLDLTDVTPRINIRKPDNEVIFQDCEIVDAKAGKVQIILENQAYLVPGTHTAEIACYKGNEITAITGTFSYKSVKGIMNDEAVESRSEFTVITRTLNEAKKVLDDAKEAGGFSGVDEQARQEIQEVSTQLEGKVSKEYVDTQLGKIGSNQINEPVTNMVVNGDFNNGTNGWTLSDATAVSSTGNELVVNSTKQFSRVWRPITYTNGDKIFRQAYIKATSTQVGLGSTANILKAHSGSGNYEKLSHIASAYDPYISVCDIRTSGWDRFSVKWVLAINLTKTFGAGKEPSLEEMEKFLSVFPNFWFDGTRSALDGRVVLLKDDITGLGQSVYSNNLSIFDWASGGIVAGGGIQVNGARIHSGFIKVDKGTIIKANDSRINIGVHLYSMDRVWKEASPWVTSYTVPYDAYIRIPLRYTDDRAITDIKGTGKLVSVMKNEKKRMNEDYQAVSRNLIHSFPGITGQSIFFVGDELWAIWASSNDRKTYGTCYRYSVDYENETLTELGSFTHDWGHVALVEYKQETDSLIVGAGTSLSSSNGVGGELEFYVFPNTSSFKSTAHVPHATLGIKYDLSTLGWGRQVLTYWGEDNNRKHNICYVGTNDGTSMTESSQDKSNLYIRKVLLGQGTNNLGNGTFISGKGAKEFNGTFKVLATHKGEMVYSPYEAYQDGAFYNGKLYMGLGHDGVWLAEITLNEDGTLTMIKQREQFWYDDNGTPILLITQAMTIKDRKLYMAIYNEKTKTAAINVYEF